MLEIDDKIRRLMRWQNPGSATWLVPDQGSSCPSVLHFGPETSGSKEDSVSKEDLKVEGKGFTPKGSDTSRNGGGK